MLGDVHVDEYARARPSAAVRPWVAFYSGYRQRGLAPAVHRGLPSPYLTLIVTLDEPLTVVAHPDPGQAAGRYATLLGGLHLSPAMIAHDGAQSGVQVALHPLGCRALLGLPAGELAATDVDAADVLGPVATELQDRVRAAGTWPQRFAAVDAVLRRRARATAVAPEVARAWDRLLGAHGAVPVSELAADVGWSARHLTQRFRTETGLGPKAAARVMRFDHARRRLSSPAVSLADLAADTGYFDQAHLAREFRSLAGTSASRWRAEEFGFLQATSPEPDQDQCHDL
jgi:AraC-like DNA-binding protein